jgi:hypothetical protein
MRSLDEISYERFLAMGPDDFGAIFDGLDRRARRQTSLDLVALGSLVRVMSRKGLQRVSQLGSGAAEAWAAQVGIL